MRRSIFLLAVFSIVFLSGQSQASVLAHSVAIETPTQLPRTVKPSHYDIAIVPDPAQSSFTGQINIAIEVLAPTASITLNAADLAFQSVQLKNISDHLSVPAKTIRINAAEQSATFTFPKRIAKGSYILSLAYSGLIGSQASGLFHLDYDTGNGARRALYTQFENSDARRFIPCWDEPEYKASFALQATVPAGQMALSNMPVSSATGLADGRQLVQFRTTPRMSTYLLFFGMGEFERATMQSDGTEIGLVTQRGAIDQADFSLKAAGQILHEFNDYFGVSYPLPKLDNIAAPGNSQFFSAMENWGAIFTFEDAILLDPTLSTQSDMETAFITEAHEMSHQWFGDLVTMHWWNDLWLNEGFASWMENRSTERLHPEWNTRLLAVNTHQRAMEVDALSTSHPVIQKIDTVDQASQAFDEITYQKGESVIRMLENYVGEDVWRAGVRLYMKQHAYGNTGSDDLWHAMEQAGSKPVTMIAHDFTLQAGVPMIKVGTATCDNGSTTLQLTQIAFSRERSMRKSPSWHVPLTAEVLGSAAPVQTLVSGGKASVTLPGCGPVLVNAGQAGYFRTLYTASQFKALTEHFAELAPIDQLGLLADTWSLSLAGQQPMADLLNLISTVTPDADPQVLASVTDILNAINRLYRHDPERQHNFNRYAVARLKPMLTRLGWSGAANETSATVNLREQLIQTLSQLDDEATVSEAQRRFAAQTSDPAGFPVALRKVISSVVALHADSATWDQLHAMAMEEKTPMKKDQLYYLTSGSRNPELARRALQLAISGEPGATSSAGMISQVAHNYPDLAFDFALAHLAQVDKLVDTTSSYRYLAHLADSSDEAAMPAKLSAYAKAHVPADAMGSVRTALANIQYNIRVRAQRLPEMDAWLAGQH